MKINLCSDAWGNTIVTPAGEFDLVNSAELKVRLLCVLHNMGPGLMIISLDQAPFLDSTGLGVLVAVHNRAGLLGVDLRLVAPARRPEKVLRITGLDQHFAIYPSLADAQNTAPNRADRGTAVVYGGLKGQRQPGEPSKELSTV